MDLRKVPARNDGRVIIHFDYDCFYASVFEARNPTLKALPLAIQQKQIIVTCNYEARRRGLYKLQLVREAKRMCPDVIIELGEDLTQFRDASKELYTFLKSFSWNGKVERLGFDEVWMDVTDMIRYNVDMLNQNDLAHSFFQLSREDPTSGFMFDASKVAGFTFPETPESDALDLDQLDDVALRLRLGSHLSLHLRHQLEQQKGYTSTAGIATSKLLSKLVGNLHKPKGQTTIMPPFSANDNQESNVLRFLDEYEIGKVPGIGFKLAQKLRGFVKGHPTAIETGLVYGATKEPVSIVILRDRTDVNPVMLEKLLAGPGSPHGIGAKIWSLLHGVDDTEVNQARPVPQQISIEDSYIRLDTYPEVLKELTSLAKSLLTRMRTDLLAHSDEDFPDPDKDTDANDGDSSEPNHKPVSLPSASGYRWLAHPRTVRLSTRPRQPLQPDGTRVRCFKRISHSCPLPNFVFNLTDADDDSSSKGAVPTNRHTSIDRLAHRLVREVLVPMFRHLHPEKAGWNLSLVNVAVTNMAETGGDSKTAKGRDIGDMFRKQEDVLKDFKVIADDSVTLPLHITPPLAADSTTTVSDVPLIDDSPYVAPENTMRALGPEVIDNDEAWNSESAVSDNEYREDDDGEWTADDAPEEELTRCRVCGLRLPPFAVVAHERFHFEARR